MVDISLCHISYAGVQALYHLSILIINRHKLQTLLIVLIVCHTVNPNARTSVAIP